MYMRRGVKGGARGKTTGERRSMSLGLGESVVGGDVRLGDNPKQLCCDWSMLVM